MRIGLAQVEGVVGDLVGNVRRCVAAVRAASELGAELVVLPELVVPGGPARDLLLDPSFVAAVDEATDELARRTREMAPAVVGTVVAPEGGGGSQPQLWSAAVVLAEGDRQAVVGRQSLRTGGPWHESRWFVPAPATGPLEVAGHRVCVAVGEDLWSQPLHGTEPLLVLSATAYRRGAHRRRLERLVARGRPVVWVNLAGASDESVFAGGSFVLSSDGVPLTQLPMGREGLRVVELTAGGEDASNAGVEPVRSSNDMAELFAVLACGVRSFARAAGQPMLVVGVSGGVDSAVVAAIAVEAVGSQRVLAVTVPSRHTDAHSTAAALELSRQLGIQCETVELEPLHRAAETVLGEAASVGTSAENIQARLRTVVLGAFVNRTAGMLLGTSNKTELTLGYGTLYGDLAGTLLPIGDLTKPEVVALGRWLRETRGWIPEWVLERPPTAELAPGQVDPFDYPNVAPELEQLVQAHRSDPVLVRSEFKRRQAGVILQVSEVAFGPGRLVPVARR